jgi:hypothetical protein
MAMKAAESILKNVNRKPYATKRLDAASKYLKITKTKRGPVTWTTVSFSKNAPQYLKPPKGAEARQRYMRAIAERRGERLPAVFPGRFN